MGKFSFQKPQDKKEDISTEDRVDELLELKKLDKDNPLERAKKFNAIKAHPVKSRYHEIEAYAEEDENGKTFIKTKSKGKDGTDKEVKIDPMFTIDLNMLIAADITGCPSNVMPMVVDQAVQLAIREEKKFRPEKRREEFNWWWIIFFLLMIPGIVFVIWQFL